MHDALRKLANVRLESQVQEADILELVGIVFVVVIRAKVVSEVQGALHLAQCVVVLVVFLDVVHQAVCVAARVTFGLIDQQIQIV